MKQIAFLSSLPLAPTRYLKLKSPSALSLLATHRSSSSNAPLCSLSSRLRKLAFTSAAIGLTILPLRTIASPAYINSAQHQPVLVTASSSERLSPPLAVVGVAKSPIHDYSISSEYANPVHAVDPIDEARREISLATRLITAVLFGAFLGVERSATTLNLGVRSVTLISLSSAVASVMVAALDMIPPTFLAYPSLGVALVSSFTGMCVYTAAKLRRPRPRNIAAMTWIVSLSVAMGTACGTGLSLVTILSCLAAVYVMRRKYTSASLLQPRRVPVVARSGSAETVDSRERYVDVVGSSSDAYSNLRRSDGVDR
ncbi:hypothetical protein FGB62_7g228 [Gracilaria domingensis]|nr:hypothetical protein FGB62_7g228 [Gracilaria domingensis]